MSVARAYALAAVGLVLGLRALAGVPEDQRSRLDHDRSAPRKRGYRPPTGTLGSVGETVGAISLLVTAIRILAMGVERQGSVTSLDRKTATGLHQWARPWLTSVVRTITWFGSLAVVLPSTSVLSIFLARRGRRGQAALLSMVTAGVAILNPVVKLLVARTRPELVRPLVTRPSTFSFPSGHSAVASAFYLTLALLVSENRGWGVDRRTAFMWGAIVAPGLVGFSRVYLGVHYLSDVVAGVALGVSWSVACVVGSRLWPQRGSAGEEG
jgi:membrane-associated phospholipid phosphatase